MNRLFGGALKGRQGAGAGSAYVAGSFLVSGVLTYVFHSLSARTLGPEGYGQLAVLWSATFLMVQVAWIGATQTLGRYVAERDAAGADWRPVASSVKRLQVLLAAGFVLLCLLFGPWLVGGLFGSPFVAAAFVAAVVAYAPEYYARGILGGLRQLARLGALHVVEATSRTALAAVLLFAGAGVAGPALALALAPLAGVLAVRPVLDRRPEEEYAATAEGFGAGRAWSFGLPVILCVASAQALMNGGPLLVPLLGGTEAQAGLLLAALIVARVPQYVLSPAIAALLPQASRVLELEGEEALDRFVVRAVGAVGALGLLMVVGAWAVGPEVVRLLAGAGFEAGRGLLATLAALAAFYLLGETANQAFFARGRGRLAALGWACGLPVCALVLALALPRMDLVPAVAVSLALGAAAAVAAQAVLYLIARR